VEARVLRNRLGPFNAMGLPAGSFSAATGPRVGQGVRPCGSSGSQGAPVRPTGRGAVPEPNHAMSWSRSKAVPFLSMK
jgi:hypothetical protein